MDNFIGQLVNGELVNIRNISSGPRPGDVPVSDMPSGFGPFTYDAPTRTAVPAKTKPDAVNPVSAAILLASATEAGKLDPTVKASLQAVVDTEAAAVAAKLK